MPEAAVHEDHSFVFGKDQIRFPGHTFGVQSVAVAAGEELRSDEAFRLGVFVADARHHGAAFGFVDYVSHGMLLAECEEACEWPRF